MKLATPEPSPETEAEIHRNEAYQDQILRMDSMEESEVKQMQKDIKYRSYQRVYQQ